MFAESWESKYDASGNLNELELAILCRRQAVSLIEEEHETKPTLLLGLGIALGRRFEHLSELADANEGIECFTRLLSLIPESDAYRPSHLHSLETDGQLAPQRHPQENLMNDLGDSILQRYERLGDPADLDTA
ncbi:hypothetical protein FRC11_008580, partial [Ceratobasidium sp. 423]